MDDLISFTQYWLSTDCEIHNKCDGADFEPDGDVDYADFDILGVDG